MIGRSLARRYAEAVFQIAGEKNEFDKWQSNLQRIAALFKDPALLTWLEMPNVAFSDKAQRVETSLGGMNPLAVNMAKLLVLRHLTHISGEIATHFEKLLNDSRGIQVAEVTTAVPLDDAEQRALAERIGKAMGKKIILRPRVDPRILGGIVARVEDRLLDASSVARFETLKRQLAGSR